MGNEPKVVIQNFSPLLAIKKMKRDRLSKSMKTLINEPMPVRKRIVEDDGTEIYIDGKKMYIFNMM